LTFVNKKPVIRKKLPGLIHPMRQSISLRGKLERANSIKPDARIIASDEHMVASAKPLKTG